MLVNFIQGFTDIFTNPMCLVWMFIGVVLGIAFGCIPGLTGTVALTLCIPVIYTMGIYEAVALIIGLYIGGCSGGLIAAILINVPGTPASVATAYDGYPMAMRGEAHRALGIGIFYSFIGGLFSFIILFIVAEPLGRVCETFGNKELFAITFFALTLVSGVAGKDVFKGLVAMCIGFSLALIGISAVDGTARLTMGIRSLNNGLEMVPALIGFYAITELIKSCNTEQKSELLNYTTHKGFGFTWKEFKAEFGNFVRSALIGTGIGIMPGIGGGTSNLVAYMAAKNSDKDPSRFGKGCMSGIVASETANNASIGGALIPMLCLGIPGDGFTAVVIGCLMMKGLNPGPLFMTNSKNIVFLIFACLLIANLFTIAVQYFFTKPFVKLLKVPKHILLSVVIVMATVGAIGINNRVFDAWTVLIFGILGFIFMKFDIPMVPTILGFLLGGDCEGYLRIALQVTKGSIKPFFTSPVSCVFIVVGIVSILLAPWFASRANRSEKKAAAAEESA